MLEDLDFGIGTLAFWHAAVRLLFFCLAWWAWAFCTFYAARLTTRLPRRPPYYRYLVNLWTEVPPASASPLHFAWPLAVSWKTLYDLDRYAPRVLGGLVVGAAAIPLLIAAWPTWRTFVAAALVAVLVAGIYAASVVYRRRILLRFFRIPAPDFGDPQRDDISFRPFPMPLKLVAGIVIVVALGIFLGSAWWDPGPGLAPFLVLGCVIAVAAVLVRFLLTVVRPLPTAAFCAGAAVAFAAMLLLGLDPRYYFVRTWVGAPSEMLFAYAAWALGGTLVVTIPAQLSGLPVGSTILAAAVLWGLIGSRDNHGLRWIPPGRAPRPALAGYLPDLSKPCLKLMGNETATQSAIVAAAEAWCGQAVSQMPDRTGDIPLVVVATAGGASRAAYWTAKLLGEWEKRDATFHDFVFAISSVSGGSLGAAAWRLSLDLPRPEKESSADCAKTGFKPGSSDPQACVLAVLQQDFLGSLMYGFLYTDLMQRFLPGALFPDRARGLEAAWEGAWSSVFPGDDFRRPFLERLRPTPATPKDAWRPILLLNGTTQVDGRRIITSTLPIDAGFRGAIDFFSATGARGDLRVSTAVHNSARFTWLDAAGTLHGPNGDMVDRIVDGGYFENFGAATALDVLDELTKAGAVSGAGCAYATGPGRCIKPIVIQITSDPELPCAPQNLAGPTLPKGQLDLGARFTQDALTPLMTFYDTRTGLGERATALLRSRVRAVNGTYVLLRLHDARIPMSWLLSRTALRYYDDELPLDGRATDGSRCPGPDSRAGNAVKFREVLASLPRAQP